MENKEPVHASKIIKRLLKFWIPEVATTPTAPGAMPEADEVKHTVEEQERLRAAMRMRWMHK